MNQIDEASVVTADEKGNTNIIPTVIHSEEMQAIGS